MTRYAGCKPFEHDASIFVVDTSAKTLFGLNLERITRIKRDPGHISLMREYLSDFDNLHFSFGSDSELQGLRYTLPIVMGISEHPIRKILRDHLISDEEKLRRVEKVDASMLGIARSWLAISALLAADPIRYQRLSDDVWLKVNYDRLPWVKKICLHDHHTCHAVSAYYHCGFDEGAIVTLDGYGNNCFSKVFHAKNNVITQISASDLRWTWGYLYANVTRLLGYYHNADEGKVEALAAFGAPDAELYDTFMKGYAITPELSIVGDESKLAKHWNAAALAALRDRLGRENLAATVQTFLEDKAVEYMTAVRRKLGPKVACAGGIFGNVKMNQAIFERAGFEHIYITPAMNDSGSAQGAAYLAALAAGENLDWLKETQYDMPYWGPSYSDQEVEQTLTSHADKITYRKIEGAARFIAENVLQNKIVGLFQGAQEWGPRALGHRTLLASAVGGHAIKERINNQVKKREKFQPFCPSMLAEECERLFTSAYQNKHMTSAFQLKDEHFHVLEAVAHIDGTARPQFVTEAEDAFFCSILQELKGLSGYGVVLNTSFNLHGRAMVLTPKDAIDDFLDCGLDAMFLQGYWVEAK